MPVVKDLTHQLRHPVSEVLPNWPIVVVVLFLKVVLAYVCNALELGNLYIVLLSQIELYSFSSCCLLKYSTKPCLLDIVVALSSADIGSPLLVLLLSRSCSCYSIFVYLAILLVQVIDLYQVDIVCVAVEGSFLYNQYCVIKLEDLIIEYSDFLSCFVKSSLEFSNFVSQSCNSFQEFNVILLKSLVPILQVGSFNPLQCYTCLCSLLLRDLQYSLLNYSFCKVQLSNSYYFLLGKLLQLFTLVSSKQKGRDIVVLL